MIPALRFLARRPSAPQKRILGIWDAQSFPYTVGDVLCLNEWTQCLRLRHQVDKIDICFVCDPRQPARRGGHDRAITEYNYHYHLASLVPLVQVNPHLGSFFLFDSYENLEKFVGDNVTRYHIWPSGGEYAGRVFAYRRIHEHIVEFYREHGVIPEQSCRPVMVDWARTFMRAHVLPDVAVTVHLRRTPGKGGANADVGLWRDFFASCAGTLPVKFVVIGTYAETDDGLRRLPNVLVAKDFQTTVEQDMALIQAAALYVGGSGPNMMQVYSGRPYLIFGTAGDRCLSNLPFANDLQRVVLLEDWVADQTVPRLAEEFSTLFSKIDTAAWMSRCSSAEPLVEAPHALGRGISA